ASPTTFTFAWVTASVIWPFTGVDSAIALPSLPISACRLARNSRGSKAVFVCRVQIFTKMSWRIIGGFDFAQDGEMGKPIARRPPRRSARAGADAARRTGVAARASLGGSKNRQLGRSSKRAHGDRWRPSQGAAPFGGSHENDRHTRGTREFRHVAVVNSSVCRTRRSHRRRRCKPGQEPRGLTGRERRD